MVVAVAVTAVLSPVGTATFGQAVLAAAGGSLASQGVGLATGIQQKFSFKSLALSAISAGVTNGIGPEGFLGGKTGLFGKGLEGAIARGALSSAITQGIGVATGLQDKFSFAGVAAAGVAAGVGNLLGGKLKPLSGDGAERTLKNIAGHIAVGAARSIASAATRSAIEGSSFSRALQAGLPDVIGQVVGQAIGGAIDGGSSRAGRVAGSTSLPQAANRTSINQPHKIAALADGSVPIEIPLIELDPISTPTLNLGKVAEQTIRAEHQGHIIVTGNRLTDVAGVNEDIGTGAGVFRPLFNALSLEGDDWQAYLATLSTRLSGQDGAVFSSEELQRAAGASLAQRLIEDNPAWHWRNRAIAERFASGVSLVPEAAAFFETFSGSVNSLVDGRLDAEIAVLQQTALDIGEIWIDTASLVITPIALAVDGYDYSQGRISTTDFLLSALPGKRLVDGASATLRALPSPATVVPRGSVSVPIVPRSAEKGAKLLPTEGNVGTYRDLIRVGSKGDDITPNHIPSANRMAREGVSSGDGIAINMEHPFPGVGGRHRRTFTFGTQADINMSARDALAAGVWDARAIYRADGLYTPQMRSNLQDLIRMNKSQHPTIFKRPGQ